MTYENLVLVMLNDNDFDIACEYVPKLSVENCSRLLTHYLCHYSDEFVMLLLERANMSVYIFDAPVFFSAIHLARSVELTQAILKKSNMALTSKGSSILHDMAYNSNWPTRHTKSILLFQKLNLVWRAGADPHHKNDKGCFASQCVPKRYKVYARYHERMRNREVSFYFCGSKEFVLPDEFLHLLSDIL